jgi:hypothetical protein
MRSTACFRLSRRRCRLAVDAQDEKIDCTSQSLNMMQLDQCAGREFRAAEPLDALMSR